MSADLFTILAAEDEETDGFILKTAFRRAGISHRLVIVRDGQLATDYLSGQGNYANRADYPMPMLIILDLKMPRMNGFDVLAWLGTHPDLKSIPAVVLSSSSDKADLQKALELGAREYFVKPFELAQLVRIAGEIQTRWLVKQSGDSTAVSA